MERANGSPAWPHDAALLDALGSAVIATDLEGRIFYWNSAAERLYGHSPGAMLGADVSELLITAADRDAGSEIMAAVLAGRRWTGEVSVRCADGSTRPVLITDSPLFRDGEVVGIIGVAEDLTEPRRARRDADLLATRLTGLARVTAELAAAGNVEEVTDIVVAQAADAVGADVASLVLLEGEMLRMIGVRGVAPDVETRWSQFPADSDVPIAVAATTGRAVVVIGDAEMQRQFPEMAERLEERSVIALPLAVEDRRLGAIGL